MPIISHSSMRALSDVPRNVTDEMLWALAKNGGVIEISFGEGFINPKDAGALRADIKTETNAPLLTGRALDDYAAEDVRKLFGKRLKVAATVEDVADHVDHAVKNAGIDHVGIGSDFDGISGPPNGTGRYFETAGADCGAYETRIYETRLEEDPGRELSARHSRGDGQVGRYCSRYGTLSRAHRNDL